jgi:hypothetical protein
VDKSEKETKENIEYKVKSKDKALFFSPLFMVVLPPRNSCQFLNNMKEPIFMNALPS